QIRRRLSEGFTEQASRVDNVRSGHRDDSIREGCRRFLEGSHGDRAHVHDEADHRAVTPLCGTPLWDRHDVSGPEGPPTTYTTSGDSLLCSRLLHKRTVGPGGSERTHVLEIPWRESAQV